MAFDLLIGGKLVKGGGEAETIVNPATAKKVASVPEATKAQVNAAIDAADAAFESWSRTPPKDRGGLLLKLADAIEANTEELARLESTDTGHPLRDSRNLDAPRTAVTFRYFGGMADKLEGTVVPVEKGFLNYVLREPIGVIGQIVPWNFPLMFTSWKLGPALAAGNTVVMKAGDIAAMPADIRHQGYSPKRSMLLVWENTNPGIAERHAKGEIPPYPVEF